ncbi:P-loop containing nucleoside triphosphate hydrolase protein [Lactarius pseudohatsudake]|nr:P-loop containing nucleoside triphosphate hydrolase protein [Lactarius pseudohatsudake]
MPSASYSHALFTAGTELWTYPTWQERTKYVVPPFSEDASPALTGLSNEEISAVKALSATFHATTVIAGRSAKKPGRDNDSEGWRAWNAWVKRDFLKWKIVQEIEAVLMEEERHPRQLIGRQGFGIKVPTMEEVGVSDVYSVIAEKLFGEDAFRDRHVARPIVKDALNKFISSVVAKVWHKLRTSVPKTYKRLRDGKDDVCAQFESFNKIKSGEKLDVSKMRKWYQNVDRLKVLATSFSDESALEELGKQTDRMNWVYKALTGDNSPAVIKGLSKNLRDALKYMAMHEDIALLRVQLAEQLDRHKGNEGPIELDVERQDVMEWTDGVEHLKTKTVDELYDMLGFEDRRIPFLVTEVDVESDIGANPRTDEEEEDVSAATEVRATQPFSLRWHQLVGVTKMVERALTSGPIMLMDDVGLGKTLQVIAFFAVMTYYRRFYSETKRYPGIWGTQEWTNFAGKKATLPECPFLFVVPPMLVDQVASECNRFLQSGSFDVILYFAGHKSHYNMWAELEKRSSHSPYMRIYVASTTAIQSDSTFIHAPCIGTRVPKVKPSTPEEHTIFGRRYLAIAIDEAHAFRNPNKVYTSMLALREKADLFVGMTATPVQTRPLDLWHIGKVIGLSGFKDDSRTNEELDDMKRSLARAKRDDKNLLLERQAESRQALHRMFEGNDDDQGLISAVNNAVDQNFRKENAKWMAVVRGEAISGLEPYEEHICLLKLYEHEYDALEALATKALDNPSFPRQFSSENFYLSVRQCLFHPVFAIKNLYEDPNLLNTYEGYRTIPSCKLNTLVEIVHHHLSVDNAPGIEPSRHCPPEAFLTPPVTPASSPPGSPVLGSQEGIAPEHGGVSRTASMPDKIIVYCYFLTSFKLIQMVFDHHKIDVLTIDGKMKQRERISTLEKFKNSGRNGPRVLLISNVGSLGLNIAFANILIIMDVLWSVMSDQQLIGRVWRHPQRKKVHVYRLIGGRSPDVLLNNLSFSKGFIQEAFMNIGGSLRKALEQGDSDETLLDDDSGANEGGTAGSPVASTSKRKGKASKEKSKGKESDIRAPRARPKSRKQAASGGPSDVEATGTGQTAGAAAARPLRGTPNEEAGPDYEFSSQSRQANFGTQDAIHHAFRR